MESVACGNERMVLTEELLYAKRSRKEKILLLWGLRGSRRPAVEALPLHPVNTDPLGIPYGLDTRPMSGNPVELVSSLRKVRVDLSRQLVRKIKTGMKEP